MTYSKSGKLGGKSRKDRKLIWREAQPLSVELRKELAGPKVGGARLRHGLGGLPGNATLKDDFVFWAKALPSRAHDAPIAQGFELDRVCIRSALVHRLLKPHAGPRLGGFPVLPTSESTTSAALLALKGRSGASPYQSWAPTEYETISLS